MYKNQRQLCKISILCFIFVISFIDHSCAEQDPNQISTKTEGRRRSIRELCPNDFVRVGNKCYYFSKTEASWTEAFYRCRDMFPKMKSELATIHRMSEDKHLRKVLKNDPMRQDRWIGGIYNGQAWTWGATGKSFEYDGFPKMKKPNITSEEKLFCVAMDPKKHYRWSSKNCIETSLYICQTKQARMRPRKPWPPTSVDAPSSIIDNNAIVVPSERKRRPPKYPKPDENYSNDYDRGNANFKNYQLNAKLYPDTQNDIASAVSVATSYNRNQNKFAYRKTETRKRISLLNRVTKRCRERDANVLKLINSTLSEQECIEYFVQRWNRKQRRTRNYRATQLYHQNGGDGKNPFIDRVTPKTLIKSGYSELHPARIEEIHDV